ncbi:MAG TPA: ion channel [Bryobacteraceae bacterium]|nr:ion channel [Bryobacteraceae bacterium]
MRKPSYDPGWTQQFAGPVRRIINRDGSFNVRRRGTTWRDFHPYLYLINLAWPRFLTAVFAGYLGANIVFALLYFSLGPGQLQGADDTTSFGRFLSAFFFSAHTLSTVGYGTIAPKGLGANIVAALEALVGVMGFATATSLLYGRISRPSAKIGFSDNMLVSPYQEGASLQFRVVNRRTNTLMELAAQLLLMTVETENDRAQRTYRPLRLEREQVLFLPLTWTVVHPIDQESPLWGKTAEDLERLQAEVLVLIKGYDDTFSQTVLARQSYRYDEIIWGARFAHAFYVDNAGDVVLEVRKVGELAAS